MQEETQVEIKETQPDSKAAISSCSPEEEHQLRDILLHKAYVVRMMLLQAAPVPIDSLSAREVSELLMDFIHYNQYVTALRLLLEKNKKQYRRAKKKNNKKNTLEMQEYTEAQKWIEEALRPEIAELYEIVYFHQTRIPRIGSIPTIEFHFQHLFSTRATPMDKMRNSFSSIRTRSIVVFLIILKILINYHNIIPSPLLSR